MVSVSVDEDIVLHSVCLFRYENNTLLAVELVVKDSCTEFIFGSKTGRFSLELLQRKGYSYNGYIVSF